jgi:hypothetical protein
MKSLYIVDDHFGSIFSMYNLDKLVMTPTSNKTKLRYLFHKQPKDIVRSIQALFAWNFEIKEE